MDLDPENKDALIYWSISMEWYTPDASGQTKPPVSQQGFLRPVPFWWDAWKGINWVFLGAASIGTGYLSVSAVVRYFQPPLWWYRWPLWIEQLLIIIIFIAGFVLGFLVIQATYLKLEQKIDNYFKNRC